MAKRKASQELLDEEGFYCLRGELLWKYRAIDAEYARLQAELRAKGQEIQEELRRSEPLVRLYAERASLQANAKTAAEELATVHREIEARLGFSLRDCSIDDKTGRIHVLGADGKPVPKAKEKKTQNRRSAGPSAAKRE